MPEDYSCLIFPFSETPVGLLPFRLSHHLQTTEEAKKKKNQQFLLTLQVAVSIPDDTGLVHLGTHTPAWQGPGSSC